ncbi:MAG: hypothetical protein CL862_01720 [Cyanobium sp. NAT70]|nr:hypothetical protein [Cyanobium sp. NAT70]
MRRLYFSEAFNEGNRFGIFSWKFRQKTGWSSGDLLEAISNQPDKDVFMINPYPSSQRFRNVWDQGEHYHPGMIEVVKHLFDACSLDPALLCQRHDSEVECYCNYWIASRRFWDLYISFSERVYKVIYDQRFEFQSSLFDGMRDRLIHAPLFPFVFERLFSTVLSAYRDSFRICALSADNAFIQHHR